MPRWLLTTLQKRKLFAQLSSRTLSGSREAGGHTLLSQLGWVPSWERRSLIVLCMHKLMCIACKPCKFIEQNNTWDVVDLPKGKKAIGTEWIFKLKQKEDGTIDRCKA